MRTEKENKDLQLRPQIYVVYMYIMRFNKMLAPCRKDLRRKGKYESDWIEQGLIFSYLFLEPIACVISSWLVVLR